MVFGVAGGFFSGTVNQSLPPLLIYFTLLGLETVVMTQILNFCFIGGKTVQAVTLAGAGQIRVHDVLANVPLTLVSVAGLYIGLRIQRRVSPETYRRLLRYVLFALALALIWQSAGWLIPGAHAATSETEEAQKAWSRSPYGPMMMRILPPSVDPQELPDAASAGARLTARYCVQCHYLPNPQMHTRERWDSVVDRMVWRMRGNGNMGTVMKEAMKGIEAPTDAEVRTLRRYLEANAQKAIDPAHPALKTPAGEMFEIACSQCHAPPDPRRHTAREWPLVVERMKRHMAWANTISGASELRTNPELKTEEIVKLLQQYARR
jgi:mono/diheme cytochrome c family protein